jgi:hypothetical protein
MNRFLIFFFIALPISIQAQESFTYPELKAVYDSLIFYRNLKIIPITRIEETIPLAEDSLTSFIPLKTAMKKGWVKISERGEYLVDNINVLMVENRSNYVIQIKSGEILIGGRQDRVLTADTLLAPNSGPHTLPVFCIEEHRWSNMERKFRHGGNTSSGLQQLIHGNANQTAIWNEIRQWLQTTNQKSSSFAEFLHRRKMVDTTRAYIEYFLKNLPAIDSNIVGILASTGHKILGADVFISPAFFYQSLPYLLEKYSQEAILSGSEISNTEYSREQGYANRIFSPELQPEYIRKKKGKKIYYKGVLLQLTMHDVHSKSSTKSEQEKPSHP